MNTTTVLFMHQPVLILTCWLVSVLRRQLYVRDLCFPFLRRCLPAVYQQLCTSREHASVQLSGLYNCSWINDAAIVHLLLLFFLSAEYSLLHAEHHRECNQSIFHTAHLWPEMSCMQNTMWNIVAVHGTELRTVTFCEYLWRHSLNSLNNKHLKICKTHFHSVTTTKSRKLT